MQFQFILDESNRVRSCSEINAWNMKLRNDDIPEWKKYTIPLFVFGFARKYMSIAIADISSTIYVQ